MSVDLRAIRDKEVIFRVMRKPMGNELKSADAVRKTIFIFDEFDLSVLDLKARQDSKNLAKREWKKIVVDCEEDEEGEESGQVRGERSTQNTHPSSLLPRRDNSQPVKQRRYRALEYDNPEDIALDDLLELFQGPVPLISGIIIATTNKFEEIKAASERLIRPGRLTPIAFNNPNAETVQEISQYYFHKNVTLPSSYSAKYSSAQLMHSIATFTSNHSLDEAFNQFQQLFQ